MVQENTTKQKTELVDVDGLLAAGLFPTNKFLSRRSLLDAARHRRLPSIKLGKARLFDVDAVRKHLAKNCTIQPRTA